MILVDTSVWIDHLRSGNRRLADLLNRVAVATHPMVIGELACGNLNNRALFLSLIKSLPVVDLPTHDEVFFFIDQHNLMGRGIGCIDAHLMASVALTSDCLLWTLDKRLNSIARDMELDCHVE